MKLKKINYIKLKYNVTKPQTFNTESPYLQNSDPHLERNINILYKNMFKTRKSSLDCFNM